MSPIITILLIYTYFQVSALEAVRCLSLQPFLFTHLGVYVHIHMHTPHLFTHFLKNAARLSFRLAFSHLIIHFETRMPTIKITSIQYSIGNPSHSNQTRKKGIQIGREEVKLSLYSDDLTLYTESPKDSAQKLLELINKFSSVVGYKTDVWKSVTFLYINKKHQKGNVNKSFLLKCIKQNLGINLTEGVKDPYAENYKTLIRETEDDSKKWKESPCSWIGRINDVKMTILTIAIYRFTVIP